MTQESQDFDRDLREKVKEKQSLKDKLNLINDLVDDLSYAVQYQANISEHSQNIKHLVKESKEILENGN